ncbi:hypothetical protein BDZ94DRAFT_1266733 [Collybia nuda]|uniref:Uncharacterized protein n=1 Tax=Collybia nuda TaxID=64659 RepID=A0A9P6CC07_9AGAR|nr:hypothetical protein BDZ94DRAFT_1266733 [Collybia nuda]
MSFQHFRLGDISLHQPLPPHLTQHQPSTSTFPTQVNPNSFPTNLHSASPSSTSKQPYGSGDTDDGYTLVFSNLEAFHAWRAAEEEKQVVEFVKGDTHGSKAVPPRFKDHTKLVCARHSRSGRKKYVKKHPERVRKVPSRKLEGQGCPASISFKTYFDTDEVRACYMSQHSHEIGPANLPFTRRGRKAAVQREKDRSQKESPSVDSSNSASGATANAVAGPSSTQPGTLFTSAVSMLAPLPGQPQYQQPPVPVFNYSSMQGYGPTPVHPTHDRWENMATLFHSVRENARGFEYPPVSVAALESILIRLYLESPPVGPGTTTAIQNGLTQARVPPPAQTLHNSQQANGPTSSTVGTEGINGAATGDNS